MGRKDFGQAVKGDYRISGIIALLMVVESVVGIAFRARVYPTDELAESFLTNDVINLLVGLPVLLVVMWLSRRDRLVGWLLWPGALFYVTYNYLIYLFSMPLNAFYLFFPLIVGLSVWGVFRLLRQMGGSDLANRLAGKVPARLSGGVLVFLGVGFLLRAIGVLVPAMQAGELTATIIGLNLSDMILSVAWIVGGGALWRQTQLGYKLGAGLLYQGSMLFLALIVLMLVQPFILGGVVAWVDVIVLAVMGLVVFFPLGMFLRGVARR
ncbi:hypothetical protein KQH54_00285 [bacterium]|nr:hypothetical protein [bacterium]